MRFYSSFHRLSAMTFDLDDTLYQNKEVISLTAEKTHLALQQWHPRLATLSLQKFQWARDSIAASDPTIVHDVTLWRQRSLEFLMQQVGLSDSEVAQGVKSVMAVFHQWRSAIALAPSTLEILHKLSQKMPLAVITNGNADPERLGISHYFQFILRSGPNGRAKPWPDMYQLAATRFGLPANEILHVGDDIETDVAGAVRAGFRSCWVNETEVDLLRNSRARTLPTIEISQLDSLTSLL